MLSGPGSLIAMKGRIISLMLAATMLAGCGILGGGGGPEEVRLSLEGAAGEEVLLVISTNFLAQTDVILDDLGFPLRDTTLVLLLTADTTLIRLPFEQRYDIRTSQRFFTRAFRLTAPDVELRMQGWVDGESRFNRSLSASPNDTLLQFLYFFTGSGRGLDEPPEV